MRAYIFDIDENIAEINTPYNLSVRDKKGNRIDCTVDAIEYRQIPKENIRYNENSFIEARDYGPRGTQAYINDLIDALERKQYGPSYQKYIEALTHANPHSKNTARGHDSETLKKGTEYIIHNILSQSQKDSLIENLQQQLNDTFTKPETLIKAYLEDQKYYGVNHPDFHTRHNIDYPMNDPRRKVVALKNKLQHLEKIIIPKYFPDIHTWKKEWSLGFSDDTPQNIEAIQEFLKTQQENYPNTHFVIYNTADPHNIIKTRITKKPHH